MIFNIHVTGIVQGVGFRPFIYRLAESYGLKGSVINLGDAGVRIKIQGDKDKIYQFIRDIKIKAPPLAKVKEIRIEEIEDREEFQNFSILQSDLEKESQGSITPPDVGICNNCLKELFDEKDRRYLHFFITCTDCGPRFTVIRSLPYDRERTSMRYFEMCDECREEYTNPNNRRFHAQTIACHKCGPKAFLMDRSGKIISNSSVDALKKASKLLAKGNIIAVKGNGGFHIACTAGDDEVVERLRKSLDRKQQPFAIMTRDVNAVERFAFLSGDEKILLTSEVKPIVVLKKKEGSTLISSAVSPGLHTIGVMLPYTALHALLFHWNNIDVLVMTSANKPGYPMVIDNQEALKTLSNIVDYFLMHDREIVQRCDDSVVSFIGNRKTFMRRSRGYVPLPIKIKNRTKEVVIATGPDTDVTFCILRGNQTFLSQHIGDTSHYETMGFFKNALQHFQRLLDVDFSLVACDLHPRFSTTIFARELSEKRDLQIVQVQHHHAHLASLLAEHGLEEMVCITADGFGYGTDGKAWGGEVLYGTFDNFERMYHLQPQPMIGGDLATEYPLRMVAGIIGKEAEEFLFQHADKFPHGEKEIEIILKQIKAKRYPITTSCGRVLDAAASALGICYRRTYEGEPARKLEATATGGKDVLNIKPEIKGNVLNTTLLLETILENIDRYDRKNLAYCAEEYIAKGLAALAIYVAESKGVRHIGFSGGCAYNNHILTTIRRLVEKENYTFLQHQKVPPGDGGVSLGQAMIALFNVNNQ